MKNTHSAETHHVSGGFPLTPQAAIWAIVTVGSVVVAALLLAH